MSNGFRTVAAQFTTVGSVNKGFWLSSAEITGADQHTSTINPVSIQTLKTDGTQDKLYSYHKGDTSFAYKKFSGWYRNTTAIKPNTSSDVFFPLGTGLWLKGTSESLSFKTSGEVVMDSVQCDLTNGFRMVANPYPTAINLSSIEITGADQHTSTVNPVSLQTLKTDGTQDKLYTYHIGDTSFAYKKFSGWYRNTTAIKPNTSSEVVIPAGAAVWVKSTRNDLKIIIPTPLEDAE